MEDERILTSGQSFVDDAEEIAASGSLDDFQKAIIYALCGIARMIEEHHG